MQLPAASTIRPYMIMIYKKKRKKDLCLSTNCTKRYTSQKVFGIILAQGNILRLLHWSLECTATIHLCIDIFVTL